MNKNRETTFHFKQFSLSNRLSAMKVGTDGVILGAWAELPAAAMSGRVLDAGCGTGVIGLMIAQRYPQAAVSCIDISVDAVAECKENISRSPFSDRVGVKQADFRSLSAGQKYDLIVSNPPFFNEALHSPDADRATARHDDTLPLRALLQGGARLLAPGGRLAMVFPTARDEEVMYEASMAGLNPLRRCMIHTRHGKPARRTLWEFSASPGGVCSNSRLIISDEDSKFTKEYVTLLRDFYLAF